MHSSTIAGSIPARATASRTASAPSSVALRSFSAPRNFPVGVRAAETMTLSRIDHSETAGGFRLQAEVSAGVRTPQRVSDARDLVAAEEVLHLLQDDLSCALDFGSHRRSTARTVEHAALAEFDRRRPRERLPDGQLPREGGSLFGRRLTPDNLREHAGAEVMDWNHAAGIQSQPAASAPVESLIPNPEPRVREPAIGYYQLRCTSILASASPRRAELLSSAGFAYEVAPANVDESVHAGEEPTAYALRVAHDKARKAVSSLRPPPGSASSSPPTRWSPWERQILGKPQDRTDAARMLRLLSDRTHEVHTAVVVRQGEAEQARARDDARALSAAERAEIAWYVGSGEPDGKAGGYAIQGRAARFIDWIEGSWSNVVGLPIATVYRLLGRAVSRLTPFRLARYSGLGPSRKSYEIEISQDCRDGDRPGAGVWRFAVLDAARWDRVLQARRRGDERPGRVEGKKLQLHGYVVDKSIFIKPDTLEYRFQIQNKGAVIQASYTGIVPDTFKDGSEVVLKGHLQSGGFAVESERRDGQVSVQVRGR